MHILDALVKSALKDDPALLGNWNLVKRVTKSPPGRPAAATSPNRLHRAGGTTGVTHAADEPQRRTVPTQRLARAATSPAATPAAPVEIIPATPAAG